MNKNFFILIMILVANALLLTGCGNYVQADNDASAFMNRGEAISSVSLSPTGGEEKYKISANTDVEQKYSPQKGKKEINISDAVLKDEWESVEEVNKAYADYLENELADEYGFVEDFHIRRELVPSQTDGVLYELGAFEGEEGILFADIRDLDVDIIDWEKDNELLIIDRVYDNGKWLIEFRVFEYEDGKVVQKCRETLDDISLNDSAYWFRLRIFYKETDGFKRICSSCTYNSYETKNGAGTTELRCYQYNDGEVTQEDYAQGRDIGTILNMWGSSQDTGFKINDENAGKYVLRGRMERVLPAVWDKDKYRIERDDRGAFVRNESKDVTIKCVYYYDNALLDKSIENADKINEKTNEIKGIFFEDKDNDPTTGVEEGHLLTKYNTSDIQSVYIDDKYFSFSQRCLQYTVNHAVPYTYETHTFDIKTGKEISFEDILGITKDEAKSITRQLIADYLSNRENISESLISELPDIEGYLDVYENTADSYGYKYYINADGEICLLLDENISYYLENVGDTAAVYVENLYE